VKVTIVSNETQAFVESLVGKLLPPYSPESQSKSNTTNGVRAGRDRKRDFLQMKRHGFTVAGG
jgi:hypothetical protein